MRLWRNISDACDSCDDEARIRPVQHALSILFLCVYHHQHVKFHTGSFQKLRRFQNAEISIFSCGILPVQIMRRLDSIHRKTDQKMIVRKKLAPFLIQRIAFENYVGILLGQFPESCEQRGVCSFQNIVMSKNELRSSGERRRRGFANGAGEL